MTIKPRPVDQDFRVCEIYLVGVRSSGSIVYVGASMNLQTRKFGAYAALAGLDPATLAALVWVPVEMCVVAEQHEREQFWIDVCRMLHHPIRNKQRPNKIHTNAINNRKFWKR